MSMQYRETEHLGDDDLVRLLDGETDVAGRHAWSGHIEGCIQCAQRLEELEDASAWLHDHVAVLDEGIAVDELARARALGALRQRSMPARRSGRFAMAGWRAAATIAVMLAAGLSVSPLRAWIVEHVERIAGQFDTTPDAVLPAAPAGAAGALVTFTPTQATFRLELDSRQAAGSISLELVEAAQASAQVVGGSGENLLVMPTGLLIENEAGSTASYLVRIPAGFIDNFEISAGGEVIAGRAVGGTRETIVIDLAGGEIAQ